MARALPKERGADNKSQLGRNNLVLLIWCMHAIHFCKKSLLTVCKTKIHHVRQVYSLVFSSTKSLVTEFYYSIRINRPCHSKTLPKSMQAKHQQALKTSWKSSGMCGRKGRQTVEANHVPLSQNYHTE